jgi:hypothetical protein
MQFLKAHYEKIILSIVLLGLAAAAALMPLKVAQEREKEEARKDSIKNPKGIKELQPVDLSSNLMVLARTEKPERLKYAGEHNLFNPVRWQKGPDGSIYSSKDAGPNALQVLQITPLHLQLKFEDVIPPPTPQDKIRYRLSVLNELQRPGARTGTPRDAGLKEKNNMFTIEDIVGPPEDPKELQVLLPADKTPVVVSREKPFERILAYSADLRLPAEKKEWKNLKVKDELNFGGETYNIVAITENEVVLSAKSNKKQTVLEYKPPRK